MTELAALLTGARLEGLDVVRCVWEREHPSLRGPLTYPTRLTQQINMSVRHPEPMPAGGAAFLVIMTVRWAEEGTERTIASGEVQLRITYAFTNEATVLSQDEASQFGQEVAQHHAWPYLRHRLQQLCMDLGINPVLLPLRPLGPLVPAAASTVGTAPEAAPALPAEGDVER